MVDGKPQNEPDPTSKPKPRHVPVRLSEDLYRVLEVARIATGAKTMPLPVEGIGGWAYALGSCP